MRNNPCQKENQLCDPNEPNDHIPKITIDNDHLLPIRIRYKLNAYIGGISDLPRFAASVLETAFDAVRFQQDPRGFQLEGQ